MTKLGYAYQKEEEGIARAIARGVRISPKSSYEIANHIRGMNLDKAKSLLENVMEKKIAIPHRRYNRGGTGHRKKIGPGRYPFNASKEFLKLLNEVGANAEFKGLNSENLTINHLATHRGAVVPGRFKGSAHNTPTTHIEITVSEKGKKEEVKPKTEEPKEPEKKPESKPEEKKPEKKTEPKEPEKNIQAKPAEKKPEAKVEKPEQKPQDKKVEQKKEKQPEKPEGKK